MGKEELIKAFRAMILEQYEELAVGGVGIEAVSGSPCEATDLVILRSCPLPVFERFLEKLKAANPNCNLLVIGKAQDAQCVERIYGKACKVIVIEGKYSAAEILEHSSELEQHHAQKLILFSRTIHDGDYLNIYETAAELAFQGSVYCQDANNDTYFMKDMSQYVSVLKLHKALCEWFWQCGED